MTKKDAYYFSHDSNSRNDLKMVKLRRKEGLAGIGLFWCVIEMLRESKGYELPIEDVEDICYELRCEESSFNTLFDCDLLNKENDVFYSISLKNRLLRMDEIKEKKRLAGSKGGKAKAKNKQNLADATKTPSKIVAKPSKEIREDKIREEEKKKENITKKDLLVFFDNFRKIYPGTKNGNEVEFANFMKKHKKHVDIIPELEEIVKLQIKDRKAKSQRGEWNPQWPLLSTWINQSRWTQEVEFKQQQSEPVNKYIPPKEKSAEEKAYAAKMLKERLGR